MKTQRSIHARRGHPAAFLWIPLITVAAALGASCSSSSSGSSTSKSLTGTVSGPSGVPVAGAIVYLVPSTSVSTEEITGAGVLAGSTLAFDEPLEDAVANTGTTFKQDTTNSSGAYKISSIPDGKFFLYVEPAVTDLEHIRGGSLCRQSVDAVALRSSTQNITMSSSPPATATYAGMTSCLTCHEDYATEKTLAHRLGFRVPGHSSSLQDTSAHPEIDNGLAYFLEVDTDDGEDYTDGTPVYLSDFDSGRGFDKFITTLDDPTGDGGDVYLILWLWQDLGDLDQNDNPTYKITMDNRKNPGDLAERDVQLTYGGAVQKQRYMISWPGLNGLYPVLQYQTDGDDARYDRTRKAFRDYHMDFYWNSDTEMIKTPDITKNISRNCLGCHAGGYEQYTDPDTDEVLAHVITDVGGEYDIDGDGFIDDLNTGCENCHGPGSAHVTADAARYVVSPEYLSPSRNNQLCGRCHNRQAGADAIGGDHPLNEDGEWPMPGISRADFLSDHVNPAVMGPKESKYWPDFTHAKSHHQQYPDFIKSAHYRNDNQLVGCSDCHNMHGGTGYRRALTDDPDDPASPLCMKCHGDDISSTAEHTEAMIGVPHGAAVASCMDCHMNKMSKSGAGVYGFLIDSPDGDSDDADITYFDNDISSHVFDVPRKTNIGVQGVSPQSAMPIPYTKACGTCHEPELLQDL